MTSQNYLEIQNNVVQNVIVWDGNVLTWQPPPNTTMLLQNETIAIIWVAVYENNIIVDFVLTPVIGQGQIGFTWDGEKVTTNQPKPEIPPVA